MLKFKNKVLKLNNIFMLFTIHKPNFCPSLSDFSSVFFFYMACRKDFSPATCSLHNSRTKLVPSPVIWSPLGSLSSTNCSLYNSRKELDFAGNWEIFSET